MIIQQGTVSTWFEFFLLFVFTAGLIWLVRYFAPKIGLLDIPNERSSHSHLIPRGGGIGFTMAVLLFFPLFHFELFSRYCWIFLAIFLILIVGFMDDHKDTSPNTKFIVIILATILLYFNDLIIRDLGTFWGWHFHLGWFALPFTLLAVVGFTNAMNLIDGLDGLASGISMVILGAFLVIGYTYKDPFIEILSLSFIISLSTFMLFNWHPASIFMGDSGSLVLGFVIALLAIKSLAYIPAVSILFLAAVPNMDVLIVLVRRKLHGRSLFSADKCHFHHILHQFFENNTRKTVLFLVILQAIYSMTALQLDKNIDEGWLLILFSLNVTALYLGLAEMIRRQNREC